MSNTKPKSRYAATFTLSLEAQEKLTRIAAAEMRSRSMVLERLVLDHYRNFISAGPVPVKNKAVKPAKEDRL